MELLFNDNFEGSGPLLSHVSDTGYGWIDYFNGSLLSVEGGTVHRPTGYSTDRAWADVNHSFYVGSVVELIVEVEVIPGSVTGTVGTDVYLAGPGNSEGISILVGNNGYCRVYSSGPNPISRVIASNEEVVRLHTLRFVSAVGSEMAELYANGILIGPFALNSQLDSDLSVRLMMEPNRTVGYIPLCKVNRVGFLGEAGVVGEFWTNIIRAAETP
ncbi:hypothetical protein [Aquipseudomonas campi]